MLVTDLSHLSRQLTNVTLLCARLCFIFILLSLVAVDHPVPYLRAEILISNTKDHTRSEVFGFLVPLLGRRQAETIIHQHILEHMLPAARIIALDVLEQHQEIVCSLTTVV